MQTIDSILTVADQYDAVVFDQWGVLHNGKEPYAHAVAAVRGLKAQGKPLAVLSNSGKLSGINRDRITAMGFPPDAFDVVMTSGEALSLNIENGLLGNIKTLYPITAKPGDAQEWAQNLNITFTTILRDADAVLLMGLPDAQDHPAEQAVLGAALALGKPLICSNPDRASPRSEGVTVQSPGALAHAYQDAGGEVTFYGKPHKAIFDVLASELNAAKVLMVGDSPEHDIAGAATIGWDTLFISGGLHAENTDDLFKTITPPTYILPTLR